MKTSIIPVQPSNAPTAAAPTAGPARGTNSVAPEAVQFNPVITQYGSVSELQAGAADFFTLTFTPGTSAAKTYVIGDPDNIVESAFGASWDEPDSGSIAVAGIKAQFSNPFLILGVNYEVTSSSAQFSNAFKIVSGNSSGATAGRPINVQGAVRNNQYNEKLLTIKFPQGVRLDRFTAMTLTVSASETVNMTFFVGAFQA